MNTNNAENNSHFRELLTFFSKKLPFEKIVDLLIQKLRSYPDILTKHNIDKFISICNTSDYSRPEHTHRTPVREYPILLMYSFNEDDELIMRPDYVYPVLLNGLYRGDYETVKQNRNTFYDHNCEEKLLHFDKIIIMFCIEFLIITNFVECDTTKFLFLEIINKFLERKNEER